MVKREASIVPIVQQDLGQEETILQIAFALDSLEKVATNIFCHVECNIEKSKQRLANLQGRCLTVKSKVQKITGISKSLTVYCSSKYPAPGRDGFYEYDFKNIEIPQPHIKVKYKPLPLEKLSMKEKLKFYHIKDRTQLLRKNTEVAPNEGLGKLPNDIRSVSSLLLFNTSENLYKQYKLVDPLNVPQKQTVSEDHKENTELEPAPISMGLNDDSSYKFDRNYFYSPSLQDVPQIEAPLDLPHLPGIAGDLRYTLDHPSIERIPSENDVRVEFTVESETTIVEALPKLEPSVSKETGVASAPPPPPPPPPPPQPIIALPEPEEVGKSDVETPVASRRPVQEPVDVRANLMEAIRKAGGSAKANLKSVSSLKTAPSETGSDKKKTGNSLMDDLHAKLSMRRKGISGKIDNTEGIMERMVSMIPPPPSKQVEVEADEDWDD